jgi:hypothetical protein
VTAISKETHASIAKAWPEIIEALGNGQEVRAVLARHDLSRGMLVAFINGQAGAKQEWDNAKELSAEHFFDQLVALMEDNSAKLDPARVRVNADILKWMIGKRNPRVYSDKSQVDINVKTLDLTAIVNAARARLEAARPARVIDVRPVAESGSLEDLR